MSSSPGRIRRWLFSSEPDFVAGRFLAIAGFYAGIGVVLSMLLRAERTVPEEELLSDEGYIGVATVHGTLVAHLGVIPALAGGLGLLAVRRLELRAVPMEADPLSRPAPVSPSAALRSGRAMKSLHSTRPVRTAALASWTLLLSGVLVLASLATGGAPPGTGWLPLLPFAGRGTETAPGLGLAADLWLGGVILGHLAVLGAVGSLAWRDAANFDPSPSGTARRLGTVLLGMGTALLAILAAAVFAIRRGGGELPVPGAGLPGEAGDGAGLWLGAVEGATILHGGGLGLFAAGIIESVLASGGAAAFAPLGERREGVRSRPRLGRFAFRGLAALIAAEAALAGWGTEWAEAAFGPAPLRTLAFVLVAAGALATGAVALRWAVVAAVGPATGPCGPPFRFAGAGALVFILAFGAHLLLGGPLPAVSWGGTWVEVAALHVLPGAVGVVAIFTGLHAEVAARRGRSARVLVDLHGLGTAILLPVFVVLLAAAGIGGGVRYAPAGGAPRILEAAITAVAVLLLLVQLAGLVALASAYLLAGDDADCEPEGPADG